MELYALLKAYAQEAKFSPDPSSPLPELGRSLSLFHSCLIEGGMNHEPALGMDCVIDPPKALTSSLLSRFIIGYLSDSKKKSDSLDILFEVYSFISWMNRKNIPHGLSKIDFQKATREIMAQTDRCKKIGSRLDSLTEKALHDPPIFHNTWHDVFAVIRIQPGYISLHGQKGHEPVRLYLPADLIELIKIDDRMELTLASTIERWIIIEQNEVFPGYSS